MIGDTKEEEWYQWTLDNITITQEKIVILETLTKSDNITENYIFIYEVKDDHINKGQMKNN